MESFSIVSGFHSWTFSVVETRRPPGRSRSSAGWPDDRVDGSLWLGTHSGGHGPADLAEGGQARTTDDAQRLLCFDHDSPSPWT
jgi:hypothetical protein